MVIVKLQTLPVQWIFKFLIVIWLLAMISGRSEAQTIAAWPFDEAMGVYPSTVLSDVGPNDYPMVLGPGGQIVPGKFGHALQPLEQSEHARAMQRLRQRGASLSEGANFGYVSL
ncbi:hypothetical protein JXO59_15305, partial [candidate division KSB1 bacterium]|nr:hypothetical protein [candidate division KSB1 bacterium]